MSNWCWQGMVAGPEGADRLYSMPDESVAPAQLGQVPTLSFITEIAAQADSDGDDSASDTGSNAGQAQWAEELDAAEWSGEWQDHHTMNTE